VLAWTDHTSDYLAEAGLAWHGDWLDIDLPRVKATKSGNTAYIPASDFTDSRMARASPMVLAFDYLYLREAPAIWASPCIAISAADRCLCGIRQDPQILCAVSQRLVRLPRRDRALDAGAEY
jgi:hypothetical protein